MKILSKTGGGSALLVFLLMVFGFQPINAVADDAAFGELDGIMEAEDLPPPTMMEAVTADATRSMLASEVIVLPTTVGVADDIFDGTMLARNTKWPILESDTAQKNQRLAPLSTETSTEAQHRPRDWIKQINSRWSNVSFVDETNAFPLRL